MLNFQRLVVVYSPESTSANLYETVIRPELLKLSRDLYEIPLVNLPYFAAREAISQQLADKDLVIAAAGDGSAQVTFDAIFQSGTNATLAVIPLGHGNDLAHALNASNKIPTKILHQQPREIHPVMVDFGTDKVALISYLTFGATTVLVDFLNRQSARIRRARHKKLPQFIGLKLSDLSKLSHEIDNLEFPDFIREKRQLSDDSLGFFNISAAKNLLRVPRNLLFDDNTFFFHHAQTKHKNLARKILFSGAWSLKFPGEISDFEELSFRRAQGLVANIAGDNATIANVSRIRAEKSQRAVKVLAK